MLEFVFPEKGLVFKKLNRKTKQLLDSVNKQQFVFFTNHDNIVTLNIVILYIINNEAARRLKIVSVLEAGEIANVKLKADIETLNRAYPNINVEFIEEPGTFGPEKIKELSKRWKIPTNFMFIGSPGEGFPYKIEELGEVRLII